MRSVSVLVVEDDDHTRTLFRLALQSSGFQVTTARDGTDALRLLDTATPALVVLDLGLPTLSGFDVVNELCARRFTSPVIVVTGLDPGDVEQRVACVLRKPVDGDELVRTAWRHIGPPMSPG